MKVRWVYLEMILYTALIPLLWPLGGLRGSLAGVVIVFASVAYGQRLIEDYERGKPVKL